MKKNLICAGLLNSMLKALFFLLLFGPILFAQAIQEEEVEVVGFGIEKYVKIALQTNLSLLIPGHEYEVPMIISWHIPSTALLQIKSDRVDIFIEIESKNITQVYFKRNGAISSTHRTILQCYVQNGECGSASKLSEEISLHIKIVDLGVKLSEYITVRASSLPFGNFSEIIKEQESLSAELKALLESAANVTQNETQQKELEKRIKEAELKISQFELVEARREIVEINALLEKLRVQHSLLMKISYLEGAFAELFKANITDSERKIHDEAILILDRAREEAFSFDFVSANNSIASADLKLRDLRASISQRGRMALPTAAIIPHNFLSPTMIIPILLAIGVLLLLLLIFKSRSSTVRRR